MSLYKHLIIKPYILFYNLFILVIFPRYHFISMDMNLYNPFSWLPYILIECAKTYITYYFSFSVVQHIKTCMCKNDV